MIYISQKMQGRLAKLLERDTKLLRKFGIMDYSLLFGIAEAKNIFENNIINFKKDDNANLRIVFSEKNNYIYFFSIIDIFQEYNLIKRIEHSYKTLNASSHSISSIPPKDYGDRFCYFMFTKLLNLK